MERWPSFFIVGAPRAGTTSLYDFLKRSDGIFMSNVKEPHFFSSIEPSLLYPPPIRNKKKYLSLFNKVKEANEIGEASASYLWDPSSPQLIHAKIQNAKIIIILRDPVQRAFSHYLLRLSGGKTYSFKEAINEAKNFENNFYKAVIVYGGLYYKAVKRYLDTFGNENIKVLMFEEFIKNPKETVKEVLEFLGVNSEPPESVELVHNFLTKPKGKTSLYLLNKKILRKMGRELLPDSLAEIVVRKILGKKIVKPPIPKEERIFLENFYYDDVKKLQKILKRKIPWQWAKL